MRHEPRLSLTIVPKGIKLLSSVSKQPTQVNNNENVLNWQTLGNIPVSHSHNLTAPTKITHVFRTKVKMSTFAFGDRS